MTFKRFQKQAPRRGEKKPHDEKPHNEEPRGESENQE